MKLLIVLLLLFLGVSQADAATLWLDGNLGSDCTTGNYSIANRNCTGSDGNAWNTWAEAMSNAAASDTINIRAGTYTPASDTELPPSGSSGNYTKIFRYQTETVTISGGVKVSNVGVRNWLHFDGLIFDKALATGEAIWIGSSSGNLKFTNFNAQRSRGGGGSGSAITLSASGIGNNIFQDCEVEDVGTDNFDHGFYVDGPSNNLIERCYVHDIAGTGIKLGQTEPTSANIVRYNWVDNFGVGITGAQSAGISLASGADTNQIYYNLVTSCNGAADWFGGGIVAFSASIQDNLIFNNTVDVSNDADCVGIALVFGDGTVVKNNLIVVDAASEPIKTDGSGWNPTNTVFGGNFCSEADTGCEDVDSAANTFITPGSDYNLKEGSPAIDSAGIITGFSEGRYVGSAPDAGAYEAPIFSNGSVENAARNVAVLNFSLPSQGVTLQSCTATDFVINVAGSNRTSTGCVIESTTQLKVTFDGAEVTEGQALTARYTRGTLTDKLLVGNLNNARVRTFSATAITNNVIGEDPPPPGGEIPSRPGRRTDITPEEFIVALTQLFCPTSPTD